MRKYHYFLITVFLLAWILAAWHPSNQDNWLQENIMIFLWVPAIIILGRYFRLSNFSYTLITVYLLFHLVGTHYNYGSVPFGHTIGEWMGDDRNQYDRFVHFCFGLLITYPLREFFLKVASTKRFWTYFIPVLISMSFSAVYELFEWVGSVRLPPDIGYLFIGGNDPWDSQKDMAIAGLGAVIAMITCAVMVTIQNRHQPHGQLPKQ